MFSSFAVFSHAPCPVRGAGRTSILSVEPGLIGRRLLAIGAASALVAGLATAPRLSAQRGAAVAGAPLILRAETATALRDQAEALRASLLTTPGVGAVLLSGLQQQQLSVEYSSGHLAALGVSVANLADGLPVDRSLSKPGHLALRVDSTSSGPQDVADHVVRVGGRVFRLGDIAQISRARLDPPVSTLTIDGRPAVRVTVVQAR